MIMMCGLPASGKSTIVSNIVEKHSFISHSTDNIIENIANGLNKTYNECWPYVIPAAEALFISQIHKSVRSKTNIIIDRTNLSINSRKNILNKIPYDYTRIAFYVETPKEDEWRMRLASRPGKEIPDHILTSMALRYVKPEMYEGFDYVISGVDELTKILMDLDDNRI